MRFQVSLPAAVLVAALGAACTDQGPLVPTGPAASQLTADAPSFQRQNAGVGQATFGNLIAALNNIAVNINNLEALNDLTIEDVQVVNVEDLLRGANIEALNNSLNRNDVDINILRDFLNDSLNDNVVIVRDVLDVQNVNISDVISVSVLSGRVTVFQM